MIYFLFGLKFAEEDGNKILFDQFQLYVKTLSGDTGEEAGAAAPFLCPLLTGRKEREVLCFR